MALEILAFGLSKPFCHIKAKPLTCAHRDGGAQVSFASCAAFVGAFFRATQILLRVLARKHGDEPGATFTVRKVVDGIGVEKIFPLYSPLIDKIEILRRSKVRRAKLYYIREKVAREIKRQMRRMSLVSMSTESETEANARIDAEAKAVAEAAAAAEAAAVASAAPVVEETPAEAAPEVAEETSAAETPAEAEKKD